MEKDVQAAEKLWMELARQRAKLDNKCTEDEVEEQPEWCKKAMSVDTRR